MVAQVGIAPTLSPAITCPLLFFTGLSVPGVGWRRYPPFKGHARPMLNFNMSTMSQLCRPHGLASRLTTDFVQQGGFEPPLIPGFSTMRPNLTRSEAPHRLIPKLSVAPAGMVDCPCAYCFRFLIVGLLHLTNPSRASCTRLRTFCCICPAAVLPASDGAWRRSVSARHWFISLLPGCPCHWPALS